MTAPTNHEPGRHAGFSGSLSEILLFDIYRQIYLTRQTGTLEVTQEDTVKRLSFRGRSLIYATTSRDSERLENLLVPSGISWIRPYERASVERGWGKHS
jgi:hypothetical protein